MIHAEQQINDFLKLSNVLVDKLREKGKQDQAQELMAFTSAYASLQLEKNQIPTKKIHCVNCQHILKENIDVVSAQKTGLCNICATQNPASYQEEVLS